MAIVLNDALNYWANSIGGGFNQGVGSGLMAALKDELEKRYFERERRNINPNFNMPLPSLYDGGLMQSVIRQNLWNNHLGVGG